MWVDFVILGVEYQATSCLSMFAGRQEKAEALYHGVALGT